MAVMLSPLRRSWRVAEFLLLTVGLPIALATVLPIRYLLPIIWVTTIYCYVVERTRQSGETLWGARAVRWVNLKPILLRFSLCAGVMTLMMWQLRPEEMFSFVRARPEFWLLVMVAYPILSVIPQEIIFRSFFFSRYRTFFPNALLMILASGLAFGFAHILFQNWVAPVLCVVGGIMFAQTYQKHRSLLLVVIEHALYGDFLFTLGLGRYFYHGAVAVA